MTVSVVVLYMLALGMLGSALVGVVVARTGFAMASCFLLSMI